MLDDPRVMTGRTVFWFRRDLRLHDNTALHRALTQNGDVIPLFIWDPQILGRLEERRNRRVHFIHRALEEIHAQLHERGSSLLVLRGDPVEIFGAYPPARLYFNHDYEPDAMARDETVGSALARKGGEAFSSKDHVLFERTEVVKGDGTPFVVFTPYSKRWQERLTPQDVAPRRSEDHLERLWRSDALPMPSIKELGFEETDTLFPPRLPTIEQVRFYGATRNDLGNPSGTTRLGVHLRFGTTSVREAVRLAIEHSEGLVNELAWREFFTAILWHFPHVTTGAFRPEYDRIRWENDETLFAAWCEGRTGFPIVDAGVRQLLATGQMHNRARMIVASFLCKDLLIDWRWGERFFARHLLDHELASNNGNWQWVAGTGCDAAPYFRVFNPQLQAKKFDPRGEYVRRWVPESGTPDYPAPIVNQAERRALAIARYREALSQRQ